MGEILSGALAGGFISLHHESNGDHFHNYILPLRNENNEIYGGMAIWHNVTERKSKDERLRESEGKYREIFENTRDLIFSVRFGGNNLSINKAAVKLFGYSKEEISAMRITDIVDPKHHECLQKIFDRNPKKQKKETFHNLDCYTKDGRKISIELNMSLIFRGEKAVGFQGVARNLSNRVEIEKLWKNLDIELDDLLSSIDDLIIVVDKNGRYLKAPATNNSLLYLPEEKLIGKNVFEVLPEQAANLLFSKINEVLDKQTTLSLEYNLEINNKNHWFSSRISPMPNDCVVIVARDITARKFAEDSLKESEEKYRELVENAQDLIYTVDLKGNFTSLNHAGQRISGYGIEEIVRMNIEEIVAPEYLPANKQNFLDDKKLENSKPFELEIISKTGKRILLEVSNRLIYKDGVLTEIQGIGRNITERKKQEEALISSETQYRLLTEGIMHQVWTAQPNGMLDYVNSRATEYLGEDAESILAEGWVRVIHPDDLAGCLEEWTRSLATGAEYQTEFRLLRHDGVYRWHRSIATAGRDKSGKIIKWFGTNTDIHDQKAAEEQLSYFAKHDPLTNLPNRNKFMDHLKRVIDRRKFDSKYSFAVLFLDLDRFKVINDSLGHLIGDKLLVSIAEKLESCVRPGDIVARLGGDEFTILLNNLNGVEDVVQITNRLIREMSKPFSLDEYEVFTSVSVGIVIADDIERESAEYLRDADIAMYRAKEAGRARYEIFNKEMHIRNLNLLQLENDLRYAVERNEFEVYYQPIVSLETGEIKEFEALIRWRHPKRGLVSPAEFIDAAEETGLIIPMGNWLLSEACRQILRWQKLSFEVRNLMIGVNLSSKQLLHPNFVNQIKDVLNETKLNPRSLRIEITESKVMENSEAALSVLKELQEIGISLSTDDFGTGFSSLSYLHRFPFDCLKIDRSFIGEMDSERKSEEIVRTIQMLAQNLNLEVIAEGIETEAQLGLLQMLGCKLGQGFYFSKPVEAKSAEKLLTEKSTHFSDLLSIHLSLDTDIVESPEIH